MTPFQRKTRILLVCTENICRSPMAEGLLRHYLQQAELGDQVVVRSAGTQATHTGCRPDKRAQKVAAYRGISLGGIKARRVTEDDLVGSDLIYAMDAANMRELLQVCPPEHREKISCLLSHHSDQSLLDVPDPYYGNVEAFDRVFRILDAAMGDVISHIRSHLPRL